MIKRHIYIYSPSGAVRDKAAFRRGVKRLQALGHDVELDPHALASHMRFAGDDATRLAAIHRAAGSGADVALISRGGYGITRILGGIRYKALNRAIENGMRFVGISDFTALQLALLAKTSSVTWAGPALCEGFGVGGKPDAADGHGVGETGAPDEIMEACFNELLSGQSEGAGWRTPAKTTDDSDAQTTPSEWKIRQALLWGGNLTLVTSLLGTPYFPKVRGGILFLEDVGEHPYRIERMLTQLLHSGVLAHQKAVLLGRFTEFKLGAHDRGFKMAIVTQWLQEKIKAPVLTNLPYGHVQTKVLLPVGAKVDLLVQDRNALIYWGDLAKRRLRR
jgi:muramoyltetrapeptide carboxypeptidase